VYLDGSGPVEITLDLPAGEYSGQWLNPMTGQVEQVNKFLHRGGDKALRTPEFLGGIALRLKRAVGKRQRSVALPRAP